MTKKVLTYSAILLGFSSLISRLLGVVRERLFSTTFGGFEGVGMYDLDIYFAAFRIPDFLFQLLILGTVSTAFVPIFSEYLYTKREQEGFRFASACMTVLLVFMIVLILGILFVLPLLIPIVVPGFSSEKQQLTLQITRIMLLSPFFFSLSSIFQSIENAYKTFFYFALAPIVYNLSIIVATLFFAEQYGVYAPAWGVVIGAVLHACIQFPAILQHRVKLRFLWGVSRPDFRRFIRLGIPRIIGLSVTQLNLMVDTIIGSTLLAGSITLLNYGLNLQSLPIGVVAVSVSIVAFGALSELAAKKDFSGFHEAIYVNVRSILLFIVPATIGMILLRTEIVTVILSGGKFTELDTLVTANILGVLSVALLAHSLIPLFARVFYALQNTKTPVVISILAIVVNLVLSLFFTKVLNLQVVGLALSTTIAAFFQWVLLVSATRKKLAVSLDVLFDIDGFMKIIVSAIVMTVIVVGFQSFAAFFFVAGYVGSVYTLVGGAFFGVVSYFSMLKWFGFNDIPLLKRWL